MSAIKKYLLLIGFVLLSAAALVIAVKAVFSGPKEEKVEVTALSILERISDQYFVVTKSVFIDQEAEIKVDTGTKWSNLFWGQTIKAEGVIRVDVGVDMSRLAEKDIAVDLRSKKVTIDVPPADILNASQYGDIEVQSKQGVLKFVLDNNPNEDHNRALQQLIAGAKEAVRQDPRLFADARQDATKLLKLIVGGLGYELVITDAAGR